MFSKAQEKILKKVGFNADQSGLINRYLTENDRWEPHLDNCRNFMLGCIRKHRPERLAILGSGWWLDIPVEEVTSLCKQVIMVDVLHPRQIIHKARKFRNIDLVSYDVTGGLIFEMYEAVAAFRTNRAKKDMHQIQTECFSDHIQADYYISLNMLDQMDSFIVDYLADQHLYTEEELLSLRHRIHSDHLRGLPKGKSCLISDFQEITTDKKGNEQVKNVIHADLPEVLNSEEWIWEFDQAGTYHPGKKTRFRVIALEL